MKSNIKYTDESMGKLRVIKDFLPPPDQLVLKEVKGIVPFTKQTLIRL